MTVRQSWSDDRIDGLERKVDEGFRHVDKRFEQVDKRFEQVDKHLDRIDQRLEQFDRRFQSLEHGLRGFHRTLVNLCIGLCAIFATLLGSFLTVVLIQL